MLQRPETNITKKQISTKPAGSPHLLKTIGRTTAWVLLWPIFVIGPALVAFILFLALIQAENSSENSIYLFQLVILLTTSFLVVVLLAIKFAFLRSKFNFLKTGGRVLSIYIWLGVLVGGAIIVLSNNTPEVTTFTSPSSEKLKIVLTSIGAKTGYLENLSINYVDGYTDPQRWGEYQPFRAKNEFSYATITIRKGLDVPSENRAVAHEYLHHIWEAHLTEQTKHNLTSQLLTLYGSDDYMKQRVASYSETNMLVPTELFSFYCTEAPDRVLTTYVLSECNKYINRPVLSIGV
jgi:hypothetical protein